MSEAPGSWRGQQLQSVTQELLGSFSGSLGSREVTRAYRPGLTPILRTRDARWEEAASFQRFFLQPTCTTSDEHKFSENQPVLRPDMLQHHNSIMAKVTRR